MSLVENRWSYNYPPVSFTSRANNNNLIAKQPSSGAFYSSDSPTTQITIDVDSSRGFMRSDSVFLKYRVSPMNNGAFAAPNTSVITSLGLASVIQRITVRLGNCEIYDIPDYHLLLALLYSTFSDEQRGWVGYQEAYGQPNVLQAGYREVCHSLQLPLFLQQESMQPLLAIAGGIQIVITLNSAANVFTTPGGTNGYQLSNISLVYEECKPDAGYVESMLSHLERGGKLTIPFVQVREFSQFCSGASTNTFIIDTRNVTSVQGWVGAFVTDSNANTQSVDKATQFSSQGLQTWHMEIGSDRIPQNYEIEYGTSPETLMISALSAYGNQNVGNRVNYLNGFDSNYFRLSYNFKSDATMFADGWSTLAGNGQIRVITTHATGQYPLNTTRLVGFLFIDSLIEIDNTMIRRLEQF